MRRLPAMATARSQGRKYRRARAQHRIRFACHHAGLFSTVREIADKLEAPLGLRAAGWFAIASSMCTAGDEVWFGRGRFGGRRGPADYFRAASYVDWHL